MNSIYIHERRPEHEFHLCHIIGLSLPQYILELQEGWVNINDDFVRIQFNETTFNLDKVVFHVLSNPEKWREYRTKIHLEENLADLGHIILANLPRTAPFWISDTRPFVEGIQNVRVRLKIHYLIEHPTIIDIISRKEYPYKPSPPPRELTEKDIAEITPLEKGMTVSCETDFANVLITLTEFDGDVFSGVASFCGAHYLQAGDKLYRRVIIHNQTVQEAEIAEVIEAGPNKPMEDVHPIDKFVELWNTRTNTE